MQPGVVRGGDAQHGGSAGVPWHRSQRQSPQPGRPCPSLWRHPHSVPPRRRGPATRRLPSRLHRRFFE